MIGLEAEKAGTIRHGTRAVLTAQTFPLPWATVLVRKAYGVAAEAHFAPQGFVIAWPSAETGVLPIESGVAVKFARQIAEAENPEEKRAELEQQFSKGLTPFPAAEAFGYHELIPPDETRPQLCRWLDRTQHLLHKFLPSRHGDTGQAFPYRG